jgi:hypothetical protein
MMWLLRPKVLLRNYSLFDFDRINQILIAVVEAGVFKLTTSSKLPRKFNRA